MNHPRLPRALIILLFILVAGTTLAGSLRSFASAQVADDIEDSSQNGQSAAAAQAPTLTPTTRSILGSPTLAPTLTAPTATLLPSPTGTATPTPTTAATLAPTSTPIPEPVYITDMTGIVTLGILVVVIILVGVTWGGRRVPRKKGQK
jgi:hypothetical protein